MSIYPVIMCGGSGTRLWPASRPERPKQFIPLIGDVSSFQSTVTRVLGIRGASTAVVIAGQRHRAMIESQLAALGVEAVLLLEPEARDSAAAMAAAAAWIAEQDPEGVAVFVSADHDIPDNAAFQAAAAAAAQSARSGRIVTLGVRPRFASTAFGYIQPAPSEAEVRPVAAFVEKPDAERAAAYVAEGYLWNSGNFVTAAATLLSELRAHAAGVAEAASEAVRTARRDGFTVTLGPAFSKAPRISIDYAVMEKTTLASVLPVDFSWADIGAWDAVLAGSARDAAGNSAPPHALLIDSEGCLVRAPKDIQVAIVGARDLAVVIEDGAVLVSHLSRCQGVKQAGDHFGSVPAKGFADLAEARVWYRQWLWTRALPLWATLGIDTDRGGWRESLDASGMAVEPSRRARVAARQAYVYASAGAEGWPGPWRQAMHHGLAALNTDFRREDGLYRTLVSPTGAIIDDTACLYDQAFVMLALAAAHGAGEDTEPEALDLLEAIQPYRAAAGFREMGAHPFQSNAQMHLFEAALAWTSASAAPVWLTLADEIAALATTRLTDKADGFIREDFNADWSADPANLARGIEPGHQFEWAALLEEYSRLRGRPDVMPAARRLFEAGLRGVDAIRRVAVNAVDTGFYPIDRAARLWPQTEYLRASLMMGEDAHALDAANSLRRYLDDPAPGLWRDEMQPDGAFSDKPSPASTLYHLVGACRALGV